MEDKRNEEKKWKKIRMEKEIREDLARLRTISSLYAANLIGEVELRVMIQEINWLSLVAATVDLIYQYQEKIPMACKDYQEKISQKALIKATKEMDKFTLIILITKIFKDKKEILETTATNNTTIEAKQMSLFFCLKFQEMVK